MDSDKQFETLVRVLRKFQDEGLLGELILIGSWCLHFYKGHYADEHSFPAVRTLDVDFLVPGVNRIKKEVDIPRLMRELGFAATFNRSSQLVKYDYGDLRVEFLLPALGGMEEVAREIKSFHIKAQALRYLTFLSAHTMIISYEGLRIRVPEPAAFALHKLIISQRRKKEAKAERDLEMAAGLLTILFKEKPQRERVLSILEDLPKKWAAKILSVSKVHFPALNGAQRRNRA